MVYFIVSRSSKTSWGFVKPLAWKEVCCNKLMGAFKTSVWVGRSISTAEVISVCSLGKWFREDSWGHSCWQGKRRWHFSMVWIGILKEDGWRVVSAVPAVLCLCPPGDHCGFTCHVVLGWMEGWASTLFSTGDTKVVDGGTNSSTCPIVSVQVNLRRRVLVAKWLNHFEWFNH